MTTIILAAGQGVRLRPHTDGKPKCMVELAGVPLLHRQLRSMLECGIRRVALVGGYRADQLCGIEGVETEMVVNPRYAATNMVATLFCAEHLMSPVEPMIISYGDIVYEPSVLRTLLQSDAPLTIVVDRQWRRLWSLRMDDPLDDAETLKLEDGDRIIELGKKPSTYDDIEGQYIGLIMVRQDHVARFRRHYHELDRQKVYDGKDFDNMYMTSFLQNLIDSGWDARAAFTSNRWLEVDTVEDLQRYQQMYADGALGDYIDLDC
jgi:L-glutamine-phosphate cytidylyltransferase